MRLTQRALPAGRYVYGELSRDQLEAFAANTNAAIARGFRVPLLDFHEDLDNLDPRSALRGCGEAKRFFVDNEGWLGYEAEVTDELAARKMQDGSIKHTSPEFKRDYKADVLGPLGDIVRHVALTNKPRNPLQGPITLAPGVMRFSIEDYMADENDDKPDDEAKCDDKGDEKLPPKVEPNPDMPPSTNDTKKMAAVIAGLAELGVVLPSDFSFDSEGAIDVLLTGLNTAVKAKQEANTPKPEEEQPLVQDSPTMQFSEDEIAKLPANVQALVRENQKLKSDVMRFSEEREASAREKAITDINRRKLPAAIKTKLTERLTTLRFSEEREPSSMTVTEVAELFEKSLPEGLRFSEEELNPIEVPNPETDRAPGTVTREEAKKINDEIDKELGYKPAK